MMSQLDKLAVLKDGALEAFGATATILPRDARRRPADASTRCRRRGGASGSARMKTLGFLLVRRAAHAGRAREPAHAAELRRQVYGARSCRSPWLPRSAASGRRPRRCRAQSSRRRRSRSSSTARPSSTRKAASCARSSCATDRRVTRRRAAGRRRRRAQRRGAEPAAGPAARGAHPPGARRGRSGARAALRRRRQSSRTAEADEHLARERALFAARRRTLDEQVGSLQAQIREAHAQAAALESQIEATETSDAPLRRGAGDQRQAGAAGLRPAHARCSRCSARAADYRAQARRVPQRPRGRAPARRASWRRASRRRATSTSSQAADELKEAVGQGARARRAAAPLAGSGRAPARALAGRRRGDGDCASPRWARRSGRAQPILDVVPAREKLVIEARIRPEDIDYVRKDAPAEVRLTAFDARTTPLLPGKVVFVSPDRVTKPESGESWFVGDGRGRRGEPEGSPRAAPAGRHAGGALRHDPRAHRRSNTSRSRCAASRAARCASRDGAPRRLQLATVQP